jgi:uncharacterized protein YecT (DUF1311 family)
MRTSESKDTSQLYDFGAAFEPEVRNRTRGNCSANFGFAALAPVVVRRKGVVRGAAAAGGVVLLVVATIARAAAQDSAAVERGEVRAGDRAAVASCLELVAEDSKRQTEAANKAQADDDGDPKPERIDPAEWLGHAGERATADGTSCIGVVSTPCQQTAEGRSNVGMADCFRRELAVWDERLNRNYKRWIDGCGEAKVCAARRKLGRAWLAQRDARCALPWIEFQGTMATPLTSQCLLDATARQAIWLEQEIQ